MDQEVPHGQQPVIPPLESHAFELGSGLPSVGSLEKNKSRHIKQKWVCQVPSFKRDSGKGGTPRNGRKGQRTGPTQGACLSLPRGLRGPEASHVPRRGLGGQSPQIVRGQRKPFSGCGVRACASVSSTSASYLPQAERRG